MSVWHFNFTAGYPSESPALSSHGRSLVFQHMEGYPGNPKNLQLLQLLEPEVLAQNRPAANDVAMY